MPKSKPTDSYQELSAELDEVLTALQSPDVRIDSAAELYERGLKLVRQLEVRIKETENKITALSLQGSGE